MTPITLATELLFGHLQPESILDFRKAADLLWPKAGKLTHGKIPQAYLAATHAHKNLLRLSEEEKEHSFILAAQAMEDFHKSELNGNGRASIFHTLLQAINRYLVLQDNAAVVRFEKLLAWRMLTTAIGQDLPVCAFLAWQDHRMNRERLAFTWPLHLPCDNAQLRGMLRNGMAENHYHLWGSLPSFHLLWLRLMGDARLHEQVLRAPLKERLHADHLSVEQEKAWRLDELSRLSAVLRLWLHERLEGNAESKDEDHLHRLLRKDSLAEWNLHHLTERVHLLSATAHAGQVGGYPVDYVMPPALLNHNLHDGLPLAYERYFLYRMWRRILSQGLTEEESHRFYLYLLIKAKVRREYVQVNDRVGFHNFKVYQDRKSDYGLRLGGYRKRFFDFWSARLAITRPLRELPIKMLEARIAPPKLGETPHSFEQKVRDTVEAAQTNLRKYLKDSNVEHLPAREDNGTDDDSGDGSNSDNKLPKKEKAKTDIADRLYFVIHFLKNADDPKHNIPGYRHAQLREELRRQSQCLWAWQEGGSRWTEYFCGIDAASAEIGCRPEVFAHAFRFLRLFQPIPTRLLDPEFRIRRQELRVTYHVGEDFLDLVDGLRAIDEAVLFLEYRRGDRLGHALALGVEPKDWYDAKQKVVMLPLQDLVDNLAWMHAQLVALGDSRHLPLIAKLERDWNEHYHTLNGDSAVKGIRATIHQYHLAWKLRGDEPEWYATGNLKEDRLLQPWQLSALTRNPKMDLVAWRKDKDIVSLYHHYHYCPVWKKAGRKIVAYDIEPMYIEGVAALQRQMQFRLRDMGIGIETNPSSNYLIGTFQRYDKHPLPSLYNLGLTYNQEALAANPQMHISINTDDLGIFDTSLENEYALMATALGKMKKPDGSPAYSPAMIMDWLDRVRAMGLQQSFRA